MHREDARRQFSHSRPGLPALFAYERSAAGPLPDADLTALTASAFPAITGDYGASGAATVATEMGGSYTANCPGTATISIQSDSLFSGGFTVAAAGGCAADAGTLSGTVQSDGRLDLMAEPSSAPGARIWEDAEIKSGRTLVSASPISGTLSGNTLSARATASFDCPAWWGTMRVSGTAQTTANRL